MQPSFSAKAGDRARSYYHRIYADFLMPNRLHEYDRILQTAVEHGYQTHSVYSFWQAVRDGRTLPGQSKHLILRHDIDTDAATAEMMWRVELNRGVRSTFYFRLTTFAPRLMKEISASGSEASYHYEEIATFAKLTGTRDPTQINAEMPRIREMFTANLCRLREQTDLPMVTVASHGDFVNRKLQIPNTVLLADMSLRKQTGIEVEAYDHELNRNVTSRIADRPYPAFWVPNEPMTALQAGSPVVLILTHPRQWRASPAENFKDNVGRLIQGTRYFFSARTCQ